MRTTVLSAIVPLTLLPKRSQRTKERWVKWLYGTASILRSTENEFVWGGNGVFQGDTLGGRVHDTALQRSLVEAAEATVKELGNQLEVVAFRDDVYVIADPQGQLLD